MYFIPILRAVFLQFMTGGDILLHHQHRRTCGDDHPWQRMPHQEITPHIAGSPHRRAMLPGRQRACRIF